MRGVTGEAGEYGHFSVTRAKLGVSLLPVVRSIAPALIMQ